jgi:hypothetical protein
MGEWRYSSTIFDFRTGGEWSASRPGRFTTEKRAPGTHSIGGCVGPRSGLEAVKKRKIMPLLGIEPQPSSHYVQFVIWVYITSTFRTVTTFATNIQKFFV